MHHTIDPSGWKCYFRGVKLMFSGQLWALTSLQKLCNFRNWSQEVFQFSEICKNLHFSEIWYSTELAKKQTLELILIKTKTRMTEKIYISQSSWLSPCNWLSRFFLSSSRLPYKVFLAAHLSNKESGLDFLSDELEKRRFLNICYDFNGHCIYLQRSCTVYYVYTTLI